MNRRLTAIGGRIGVWTYRRFDGRVSGGNKKAGVLMLTTPGRRSGLPRSSCVRFIEKPEGYLVWGTGSGARSDPDWFRNLRAAGTAEVQVGARRFLADARELTGAERDQAWDGVILATLPGVRRYADKARRTIPVAVLTPREDAISP